MDYNVPVVINSYEELQDIKKRVILVTSSKKSKSQQTLVPFLRPAFKRTISILSLVADFVDDYKFHTNWESIEYQGWRLIASADPHYWCGNFITLGCLQAELHEKLGKGKMIYVKHFQRCCYRAKCKVCYLKWMARLANAGTRRIEHYSHSSGKKPIHLILCVPSSQYNVPVKVLRQRMSKILKIAKIEGAAVIFHPFRFNATLRVWYPAPHFHLVGFGNEEDIKNAFGKFGWFVKEAGYRKSVFQTLCYLLSHCGVKKGYQAVTWFGSLSYSKLPYEKEPKITKCPVCGGKFEEIYYADVYHPVIPPGKSYEGLVAPEGWYSANAIEDPQKQDNFPYHPIKQVNDILESLAIAN
jgi:hypothetical protein